MRIFTLALLFLGTLLSGISQPNKGYYYLPSINIGQNPGGLFTFNEGSVDGNWNVIHSGVASDPVWTPIQNVPFLFYFNGEIGAQFKVSSSGVLTFDTSADPPPPGNNTNLPAAVIPDKSVMVWGLEALSSDDKIATRLVGNIPKRQLWISFVAYGYKGGLGSCNLTVSIVLEEGTNNIYIVDQRKGLICLPELTYGIQMDQFTATEVLGSPKLNLMSQDNAAATDNSYYKFIPGEQVRFDLEGIRLDLPDLIEIKKAPIIISGKFQNFGSQPFISGDLNYAVNGGPAVTTHISGVPANIEVSHKIPWIPTTPGTYKIDFWISSPNGEVDGLPANDTLSKTVTVLEQLERRKVFVEMITQHNCPPCAIYEPPFDQMLAENEDIVVALKYASSWPGANDDPRRMFNQPAHAAMINPLNVNAVPTALVDGNYLRGNPGNLGTFTNAIMERSELPSAFNFLFTEAVNGNNIDITVEAESKAELSGKNLALVVAISQDELHYPTATGTNGEKDYYQTLRYLATSASGVSINGTIGSKAQVSFSYQISPIFRESGMRISAWIWDTDTREVFAADKSQGIYLCAGGGYLIGSLDVVNASCGSNDGAVSVSVSGGSGNYTYTWDHDTVTSSSLSSLIPGQYRVTVSDSSCSMELKGKVDRKPPPNIVLAADNISCSGANDGKMRVYTAGGTPPYTYTWSNGDSTEEITNLSVGSYFVSVTDAEGCKSSFKSATVLNPPASTITNTSSTPDNGTNNGTASVFATGGVHPYTYSWDSNPPQDSAVATGLAAGIYTVTVMDYNGCLIGTRQLNVDSNVGIEEDLAKAGIQSLEVFPNPTSAQLNIRLEMIQADELKILLMDARGKQVYRKHLGRQNSHAIELNVNSLPSGVYLLQLHTSTSIAYSKVVIE